MKNILLSFIILTAVSCKAQMLNAITLENLTINNFRLGASSSEITESLGQPVSVYTEYWEIGDVTVTIYQYLGSKFEFVKNELVGFKISDPSAGARLHRVPNCKTFFFLLLAIPSRGVSSGSKLWLSKIIFPYF